MTKRPDLIKAFILGAVAAGVAGGVGALLFMESGSFDVAALRPHTRLTYFVVNTTMRHSVEVHSRGIEAPGRFSATQVLAGFCQYEVHCVMCHGALSVGREPWVNGMTPTPPYLVEVPHHWTPAQTFWIVRSGIKMTAMPAWQDSLSDRQIWDLVAFLYGAPNTQPGVYLKLRAAGICKPRAAQSARGAAATAE